MTNPKMHDNEVDTDANLVRRLLVEQFPQWAGVPINLVRPAGTDNAMYRLGDTMAARLPRIDWAGAHAEKEFRWLPQLAPHLLLPIPVPIVLGSPGEGYPWHWLVQNWLPGENATNAPLADRHAAAKQLAQFITALHHIDPTDGPAPGDHNSWRGVPLAQRDRATRENIAALGAEIDPQAATAAWESALRAPVWDQPSVWIHGDLQPGNLLVENGALSGVIDFGCLGVGDPACDLLPAWNLFDADTRRTFRAALDVDNATWERGRGWALSVAVIALPYYRETNPALADLSRYTITQVLADSST